MPEKEVILTAGGFQRLSEEIEYLSSVKREEISERIKDAREFGDISENSEYNEAKNEQAKMEMRISQLEHKLRNARVLDGSEIKTDAVGIGSEVHIKDVKHGDSFRYVVVGSAEADPANKRLSNESPVGKAIMDRKAGETVKAEKPGVSSKSQQITIQR